MTVQYYREQPDARQEPQVDRFTLDEGEEELQVPVLPADARNLTYDMLLGDTKKKPRQFHLPYLEGITHLMMNKKKLSSVIQLTAQNEVKTLLGQYCPKLTHVFLQENYLSYVGSVAFKGCKNILQINLFNNNILKMDCFDDCQKL
jgi:hypothetical protein